ncbi:MAG: GNAT family N-acetyltransferase [Bacteroidales bacterium]
MKIEFQTTTEITTTYWESYTSSFNQVFEKEYKSDYFKHKYQYTIDDNSYHVFLTEESSIVGGCTVIPYEYFIDESIVRCGLAVDVFILPEYRTDPLALYRMYKALKKELIQRGISMVIAVPNDVAYPYWKNVVKWKDVGFLNYYALPVKAGTVVSKFPFLINPLSFIYSHFMLFLSGFNYSCEKFSKIRINRQNKVIEKQRYTQEHIQIHKDDFYASYRIVNEDGIKTCYLIDFYSISKACKDAFSLQKAIKTILATEKIDIIIFVGKLNFFQLLLLKVPFKFEPKHLFFTADILIPENINTELIYNIQNWDFGLFNYDVR